MKLKKVAGLAPNIIEDICENHLGSEIQKLKTEMGKTKKRKQLEFRKEMEEGK